jgi:hypothetical protein
MEVAMTTIDPCTMSTLIQHKTGGIHRLVRAYMAALRDGLFTSETFEEHCNLDPRGDDLENVMDASGCATPYDYIVSQTQRDVA